MKILLGQKTKTYPYYLPNYRKNAKIRAVYNLVNYFSNNIN